MMQHVWHDERFKFPYDQAYSLANYVQPCWAFFLPPSNFSNYGSIKQDGKECHLLKTSSSKLPLTVFKSEQEFTTLLAIQLISWHAC